MIDAQLTVIATAISIIALASLLFSVLSLSWTKHAIREARQALMLFDAQLIRRDEVPIAEIWTVPEHFQCITPGNQLDGVLTMHLGRC